MVVWWYGGVLILFLSFLGILSVFHSETVQAVFPIQYYFVPEHMTQPDAKTYCRQKYTDLVTFHNAQETQEAMAAAHASDSDYIWIGLERQTSEKFIWSYDNANFYQPGESEYRNWDVNEPNGQNSDEKCVEMRSNSRFNDYLCSEGLPFICYSESSVHKYVIVDQAMSWPDAQRYCRDHHTDLASVRNQAENLQLVQGENMWIGLYSDSWGWSDQDGSAFRPWVPGQPNNYGGDENCVVASVAEGGRLHDVSCQSAFPFICYGGEWNMCRSVSAG
ncbi:hypothetical protein NFI96_029049 [Prochilodus magdalenae]|nr:hypothetical protein NFI96_029049 [Prochilodus magdalenae]